MASTKVEVEIVAVLKEAKKAVDDFAKTTQKQLDGLNFKTTVSAISDGFRIIEQTAGKAFGAVKGFVSEAIDEAIQGEEALTKLSNSMRLVGDFTNQAQEDFRRFADEVQNSTTVTDDQALSALALAKNFNLTNKEAKAATLAAIDFSAATGKDLDSAVQSVSRTLTGFVDRDLGKYLPQLKAISKEQLVAGEGIRIISDRFNGFATALGETFQGSIIRARNQFNNLLETIGQLIVTNPVVIQSIQIIAESFGILGQEVERNRSGIQAFIGETVKSIAALAPTVIQIVKGIDFALSAITNLFKAVAKGIAGFVAAIQAAFQGNFVGARDALSSALEDVIKDYEGTRNRLKGFYDPLINSAKTASDRIQQIDLFKNLGKGSGIDVKFNKSEAQIVADRLKNALVEGGEDIKKKLQEAFDKQTQNVSNLSKNPALALFPERTAEQGRRFSSKTENSVAVGAGLASSILGGAQGATELVKGVIGAAANALIPGLGPVVEQIVGVLAKGPEEVRKLVREFAAAIPSLIENIILAVPVLVEEIAKAVPLLVQRLVEAIPTITNELVKALPTVAAALAAQMPTVAVALVSGIVSNIPKIVEGFAREFLKIPERFVDALLDAIPGGSIFGGGDGGGVGGFIGDIFGGVGDIFGFAEGGRVPDRVAFRGDGFPARLDAGEQVLSRDLTNRLEAFLDGGSAGGSQTVIVQVGQQELARAIFELNRGGFRTA